MIKKANIRKSILLVDDDHSITQTLSMLLETRGYNVEIAHSGQEVFEKITDTVDLILLDLVLPDHGGFEICRRLREGRMTNQIPIIILSAKLFSGDIVEGLYLGADDYLTKPFEWEELVARMEAVMRRGPLSRSGQLALKDDGAVICEIRRIIEEELIVPVFQPIFLFNPFTLFGFEALGRPAISGESALSNPELLFKCALQLGFYHDLEVVSWKKAVARASEFIGDKKLFLNCDPYLVEAQKFDIIKSIFDDGPVSIANVVLEITERSAISNSEAFYGCLERYRKYGFKLAVDDVGSGYATFGTIAATRPEIVKIDRRIVNGFGNDPFKRSIVKFIVAFCKEHKILSIAEGIERQEDLNLLIELGVDAGQGYYLGRPSADIKFQGIINNTSARVSGGVPRDVPPGTQSPPFWQQLFPAPCSFANGSFYMTGL